jgi:hypothetical protein
MKSNRSAHGSGRSWVPPTVTKLAIGTQTKSPVAADHGVGSGAGDSRSNSVVEPQPPRAPAMKFGFALEWSFPLAARTD